MFNKDIVFFIPTFLEAEKLLNISDFKVYNSFNISYYKSYPVVITGCGKTNAAFTSALFFSQFKVKYPILTGICGAYYNSGLNIGDVVTIKNDFFVDECNYDGKNITLLHEKGFILANDNCGKFQITDSFKQVDSNTVSFIPQFNSLSNKYHLKTNALVENMEGASFGNSANKFNVLPQQVRAVSNYCGDIKTQNWDIKTAGKNLKNALNLLINTYVQLS